MRKKIIKIGMEQHKQHTTYNIKRMKCNNSQSSFAAKKKKEKNMKLKLTIICRVLMI